MALPVPISRGLACCLNLFVETLTVSLIRIGQVVVNFANVTTVTRVEGSVNLVVRFVNGEEKTFEGDEALGLQAHVVG